MRIVVTHVHALLIGTLLNGIHTYQTTPLPNESALVILEHLHLKLRQKKTWYHQHVRSAWKKFHPLCYSPAVNLHHSPRSR